MNERFSKKAVATHIRRTAVNIQKEHNFDRLNGSDQLQKRLRGRIQKLKDTLSFVNCCELNQLLHELERDAIAYGRKEELAHLTREFDLGRLVQDMPAEEEAK